jgi:hypothetical protein
MGKPVLTAAHARSRGKKFLTVYGADTGRANADAAR